MLYDFIVKKKRKKLKDYLRKHNDNVNENGLWDVKWSLIIQSSTNNDLSSFVE